MKKLSKLTSALLALLMIMSLFAACGKDDDKKDDDEKDSKKDEATVQVIEEDIEENTEEYTTEAEETTKENITIKVPGITKVPATKAPATKAPATKSPVTKAPATKAPVTQAPTVTKAPTSKPDTTQKEEPKPSNADLLIGTWETTIVSDGLPVTMQFKFEANGTMKMDFTKASYDKMVKHAVDSEMSNLTDEEIIDAGFANRKEAEDYLYALIAEEAPYDQLRSMLQNSGTWKLNGDDLTVTIDGESATSKTNLSAGKTSFELKDPTGESITLTKV